MEKKKLFILDDEEDIVIALIARFAATDMIEVSSACDPEIGLDKIKTFMPDVVLLDIMLPKMDGWEVCRRLRADPATKDITLVVMTGIMSRALLKQAFAADVMVITKPLDEREIEKVIAAAGLHAQTRPRPAGPSLT